MVNKRAERKIAFVVPTLNGLAAQDENIVQLILFAAALLEQEITTSPDTPFSATIITVDNNGTRVVDYYFTVPLPMSTLFIPNSIVDQINNLGNTYGFMVELGTKDGNNRTYSKTLTLDDIFGSVRKRGRVVVVPMF